MSSRNWKNFAFGAKYWNICLNDISKEVVKLGLLKHFLFKCWLKNILMNVSVHLVSTGPDHINRYTCRCVSGYKGPYYYFRRYRRNAPVRHGFTEHEMINRYACICEPRYTGVNCQTAIEKLLFNLLFDVLKLVTGIMLYILH